VPFEVQIESFFVCPLESWQRSQQLPDPAVGTLVYATGKVRYNNRPYFMRLANWIKFWVQPVDGQPIVADRGPRTLEPTLLLMPESPDAEGMPDIPLTLVHKEVRGAIREEFRRRYVGRDVRVMMPTFPLERLLLQ